MWQNLIQALKDLSDAYAALLDIESKKSGVLVAVDMKGLEALLREEEQQLERIRVAEKSRQDALSALSKKIPSIHSAMTMKDVEAICPKELSSLLHVLHTTLGQRVEKVREAGGINEFLIRNALGAVEYHLNRLSNSSIDPTYGQKGKESVTREKKFDFQA